MATTYDEVIVEAGIESAGEVITITSGGEPFTEVYSDDAGADLIDPLIAAPSGQLHFFVVAGTYKLSAANGWASTITVEDEAGGGGGGGGGDGGTAVTLPYQLWNAPDSGGTTGGDSFGAHTMIGGVILVPFEVSVSAVTYYEPNSDVAGVYAAIYSFDGTEVFGKATTPFAASEPGQNMVELDAAVTLQPGYYLAMLSADNTMAFNAASSSADLLRVTANIGGAVIPPDSIEPEFAYSVACPLIGIS
jgi:hypothetical protein